MGSYANSLKAWHLGLCVSCSDSQHFGQKAVCNLTQEKASGYVSGYQLAKAFLNVGVIVCSAWLRKFIVIL